MFVKMMGAIKDLGATAVCEIAVADIVFEPEFRSLCESNSCGKYGTTWSCPPHAGEAETLIAEAKCYEKAIVYQTVSPLEDSFDIEGMQEASRQHHKLSQKITDLAQKEPWREFLNLGAGACSVCKRCAVLDEKPCYFPEKRVSSVDAYCIYVTKLAQSCNLNYINGQNTVTYFGVLLINEA